MYPIRNTPGPQYQEQRNTSTPTSPSEPSSIPVQTTCSIAFFTPAWMRMTELLGGVASPGVYESYLYQAFSLVPIVHALSTIVTLGFPTSSHVSTMAISNGASTSTLPTILCRRISCCLSSSMVRCSCPQYQSHAAETNTTIGR
jgi:hypothetical protein